MNTENRKLLNIELGRVDADEYRKLPDSGIVMVLDNIRSAHNVGSAFRSGDSFKTDKIYLCGICATPPSAEIHKSALGAEDSVPWEYAKETLRIVERLKSEGYTIVSVEQTVNSIPLDRFNPYSDKSEDGFPDSCKTDRTGKTGRKYALIFGNEVSGIDQAVVNASDISLEIPQFGTKHSLNVSVSIGIILWHFRLHLR